jgi:3-phosphoshikimate 1-carboxyvinyltransferase
VSPSIVLHQQKSISGTVTHLPASKSISNRVLILDALAGGQSTLENLSEANDTRLMRELISSTADVLDVEDAGTTMRFLTAYCAVTNREVVLTGTERMQQRPIQLLVEALRQIGASIEYLGKEGYPPLRVRGMRAQLTNRVKIRGDVSSQYISALMMVAAALPQGLEIMFEGAVTSKPYIEMTASLMRQFGVESSFTSESIRIAHQRYQPTRVRVEADWSAISYWFAFAALAESGAIILPDVTLRSLQGDRVIVDIMEILGVQSEPRGSHLVLRRKDHHDEITWDFTNCPDLAQTVAVVCAAQGITGYFTGLQSLRIKETDRIKALQQELGKLGAVLEARGEQWVLIPPAKPLPAACAFETYLDHRMAMAFAPLATRMDVTLADPPVVRKSYPRFWDDVAAMGIRTAIQAS